MERLKSRAFQIATGLTVLLVLASILLPQLLGGNGTEWKVAVVGLDPGAVEATMEALQGDDEPIPVEARRLTSRDEAVASIEAGDADAALIVGEGVLVDTDTSRLLETLSVATMTSLQLPERAAALGLTPQEVATLLGSGAAIVPISEAAAEEDDSLVGGAETLALVATILLFVSIVTYGQWILIGVIEEKSNRVVEVVVGTVPPRLLLIGKVLGIGLLGLLQLLVVAIVAFVALQVTNGLDLPATTGPTVAATALWFLLGFAFYATAYAAAGALVSRQEEAQNAAFPMTLVLMGAYFLATFSISGDNQLVRIASLLPPFAPMTMPMRIALGRATSAEIAISYILMIIGVWLLMRFAARVYRGGILRSGGKIRINEALRSAED